MSELTKELDRRIEANWMTEPQDVRRMLNHNTHDGRNFGQWVYAYMHMYGLQHYLYQYYKLASSGNADINTLIAVVCNSINNIAGSCKNNKMEDTMSVLYRSSTAISNCGDLESMAEIILKVQRYINGIFYAIDFALPWSEMSKTYEKLMKEYVPPTRENYVDLCDD